MLLQEHGFNTIPIHPKLKTISGIPVTESLTQVSGEINTITMYVGPQISQGLVLDLIRIKPKRIIFNPGSENPAIYEALKDSDIEVLEACTLVMLKTGQL
jgi:predicted CoA-binding protein